MNQPRNSIVRSMTWMRGFLLLTAAAAACAASIGPSHGSLLIVGGGTLGAEIEQRFIQLAGGVEAPMIFIPTAEDGEPRVTAANNFLARAGVKHVTLLHTRDRKVADSEAFVKPLRAARGYFTCQGKYATRRVSKEAYTSAASIRSGR